MNSLAAILAGIPNNPQQQPPQGLAPLLSQLMLAQSLTQGGQNGMPQQPGMPQMQGQGMTPNQQPPGGWGQIAMPGMMAGLY